MSVRKRTMYNNDYVTFWKVGLLTIAVLLNIILAFRLIWGAHSFTAYKLLTLQYQAILEEIEKNDRIITRLSHEIQLLQKNPFYMEQVIRQHLNFVKDNEIIYLFSAKNK